MSNDNIIIIKKLVNDLLSEFEKEEDKLRIEHEDMSSRVMEINEDIHNYHENEDVNIQVFSPRKVDNKNEARLDILNTERDVIENDIKSVVKQIKYYSDKTEKLRRILELVDIDMVSDTDDYVDSDDVPEETHKSNFSKFYNGLASDLKDEEEKEIANLITGKNKEDLADELSRISHKVDFCNKIIDSDLYRTKMELKSLKRSIDEIVGDLQ